MVLASASRPPRFPPSPCRPDACIRSSGPAFLSRTRARRARSRRACSLPRPRRARRCRLFIERAWTSSLTKVAALFIAKPLPRMRRGPRWLDAVIVGLVRGYACRRGFQFLCPVHIVFGRVQLSKRAKNFALPTFCCPAFGSACSAVPGGLLVHPPLQSRSGPVRSAASIALATRFESECGNFFRFPGGCLRSGK